MFTKSVAHLVRALWGMGSIPVPPGHPGTVMYRYRGGRPPRGKKYPNANARGISPKVHRRFQEAASRLEGYICGAYVNALENGSEVWDAKSGKMVPIRDASPAAVLSDMMDCSSDVYDRLRDLTRLFFTDGHHRAASIALKVLRNKRRVWNRRFPEAA